MSKKELSIKPPPREPNLFRAVYVIDVHAENAHKAAQVANAMMRHPDSLLPVFDIIDHKGNTIRIDLSKSKGNNSCSMNFMKNSKRS